MKDERIRPQVRAPAEDMAEAGDWYNEWYVEGHSDVLDHMRRNNIAAIVQAGPDPRAAEYTETEHFLNALRRVLTNGEAYGWHYFNLANDPVVRTAACREVRRAYVAQHGGPPGSSRALYDWLAPKLDCDGSAFLVGARKYGGIACKWYPGFKPVAAWDQHSLIGRLRTKAGELAGTVQPWERALREIESVHFGKSFGRKLFGRSSSAYAEWRERMSLYALRSLGLENAFPAALERLRPIPRIWAIRVVDTDSLLREMHEVAETEEYWGVEETVREIVEDCEFQMWDRDVRSVDELLNSAGSREAYKLLKGICDKLAYDVQPVGQVSYASGKTYHFMDERKYLECIHEELPDGMMIGFGFRTLTDDPAVYKAAVDEARGSAREESREALEDYVAGLSRMAAGPVGRVSYASGETYSFMDAKEYIECIREELPYRATTGFRFETLTGEGAVRKAVDDEIFNLYGEENPKTPEDYAADPFRAEAERMMAEGLCSQEEAGPELFD